MKKQYTAGFKAKIVEEMLKEEKTISQLSAEYGVHPTQLNKWKAIALKGLPSVFEANKTVIETKAIHQKEIGELYAQIGRLMTQLEWVKKKCGIEPPPL